MGRVNTPVLDAAAKVALEEGYKTGSTHSFRMRCQVVLLKATGRGSVEVGTLTGMGSASVNAWVKRHKTSGLAGLKTKPGRGRKPLLSPEMDQAAVLESVQAHRQRVQQAKADWEQATGRSVGLSTFKAFLKVLAVDIKESAKGAKANRIQPCTS